MQKEFNINVYVSKAGVSLKETVLGVAFLFSVIGCSFIKKFNTWIYYLQMPLMQKISSIQSSIHCITFYNFPRHHDAWIRNTNKYIILPVYKWTNNSSMLDYI